MRLLPKREEDPIKRRKARLRRLAFYAGLILGLGYAYYWQPVRYDVFPTSPPNPNPKIDPDSERLFSKGTKVVLVTAHPDDSEYYVSPLLLRLKASGAELHHVLLTDGDKAYMFWQNNSQLSATRRAEQKQASTAWGAKTITFLGFRDGRLGVNDETIQTTRRELEKIQPYYVLAFDPEYPPRVSHGDHRSAGAITVKAVEGMAHKPRWLLLYSTTAANYFPDVSKTWTAAQDLLEFHKSQWTGDKLQRVKNTVSEDWIQAGEQSDQEAAVPLRAVKLEH